MLGSCVSAGQGLSGLVDGAGRSGRLLDFPCPFRAHDLGRRRSAAVAGGGGDAPTPGRHGNAVPRRECRIELPPLPRALSSPPWSGGDRWRRPSVESPSWSFAASFYGSWFPPESSGGWWRGLGSVRGACGWVRCWAGLTSTSLRRSVTRCSGRCSSSPPGTGRPMRCPRSRIASWLPTQPDRCLAPPDATIG